MIKGKFIGLRAIEKKDLLSLMIWRNNPKNRRFFREYRELNETMQLQWYENIVIKDPRTIMFSIIELETEKLLGACGLCYINWINRNADFSIYIGKDNLYIDGTFAPDAGMTLINYAFSELNMHKLWTEIYDFDKAKIAFFKALGFTLEGTHKETYWHDNKWHNSLFYSLLKWEYNEEK